MVRYWSGRQSRKIKQCSDDGALEHLGKCFLVSKGQKGEHCFETHQAKNSENSFGICKSRFTHLRQTWKKCPWLQVEIFLALRKAKSCHLMI